MNARDRVLSQVRQHLQKEAGLLSSAAGAAGKVVGKGLRAVGVSTKPKPKKFWTMGKKLMLGGAVAAPMAFGAMSAGKSFAQRDLAPPAQQPPGY